MLDAFCQISQHLTSYSLTPPANRSILQPMNDAQKTLFLISLRETGLEATSARAAGVRMAAVKRAYEEDAAFAEECQDAMDLWADRLEEEARRRAVEGVEKGIYYQGALVAHEQQYSDTLLAKLLTGRRPQVFGDKKEITGAGGGPIQVIIEDVLTEDEDFL